jgi:hypothetical protein
MAIVFEDVYKGDREVDEGQKALFMYSSRRIGSLRRSGMGVPPMQPPSYRAARGANEYIVSCMLTLYIVCLRPC